MQFLPWFKSKLMDTTIKIKLALFIVTCLFLPQILPAQHSSHDHQTTTHVEPQPLLAQAIRLQEALSFLGKDFFAAGGGAAFISFSSRPGLFAFVFFGLVSAGVFFFESKDFRYPKRVPLQLLTDVD